MPFKVIYSLFNWPHRQRRKQKQQYQKKPRHNDVEMKAPLNCNPWPIGGACALAFVFDAVSLHSRCLLHCLKTGARLRVCRCCFFKCGNNFFPPCSFFNNFKFTLTTHMNTWDEKKCILILWMRKKGCEIFFSYNRLQKLMVLHLCWITCSWIYALLLLETSFGTVIPLI